MSILKRGLPTVLLMITIVLGLFTDASGQAIGPGTFGWSTPINISEATGYRGFFPKIIADTQGNVHAFWGGWVSNSVVDGEKMNAIFYRQRVGNQWANAVDIIYYPSNLNLWDVDITPSGNLLVLWSSNMQLFLSQSPYTTAMDVKSWITEELIADPGVNLANIIVDPVDGRIFVTYTLPDSIYLMTRSDRETWRGPILVSYPQNDYVSNGHGCISPSTHDLYLAWTDRNIGNNPYGTRVRYGRWNIDKQDAVIGDIFVASTNQHPSINYPILFCGNNGLIMGFWNNGVGSTTGRFFAVSTDEGLTWQVSNAFNQELSGQTGFAGLSADRAGRIHLVTSSQSTDNLTGVRYAYWTLDNGWSDYISLWPELSGEWPDITISLGNEVHIVWHEYSGNIYYTSLKLDLVPVITSTPIVVKTQTPVRTLINTSEPPQKDQQVFVDGPYQQKSNDNGMPVILGGVGSLLLVSLYVFLKNRNQ